MDRVSKEKRSEIMSRIRSKGTKPEMRLHGILKGNRIRHRMWPDWIEGHPDIVLLDHSQEAEEGIEKSQDARVDGCRDMGARFKMRFIDLFGGCGGMSKGFELAGMEGVGFVELWQPAIDTHLKNCKGTLIGKDITKIGNDELKELQRDVDLIIGGPPCQGFSMAGKRRVGDLRNSLYKEFLRFVGIINPDFFVMENVPGIGSMYDLDGKLIVLKIMDSFKEMGYDVDVKVLNSSNYGVPQERRRAIFIGNNKGLKNEFPDFKGKVFLKEVLNLSYVQDEKMQHIYEDAATKSNYRYSHLKEGQNYGTFKANFIKLKIDGFSRTITKSGRYIHPEYNRLISVREAARIQSFPDDFMFCGSTIQMYQQIGNAVPVKMAQAIAEKIIEVNDGRD